MAANTKTFVVDASFVLSSLLPDEESPVSDEVLKKYIKGEIELVSTHIFDLEVLNGLRSAALQKRISKKDSLTISEKFLELGIRCDVVDAQEAFLLATDKKLSVYDATYIHLAEARGLKLLTLDRKMEKLTN